MNKRKTFLFLLSVLAVTSGCSGGSEDPEDSQKSSVEKSSVVSKENSTAEKSVDISKEEATEESSTASEEMTSKWTEIKGKLQKETEAEKVETLYENNDTLENSKDGMGVTIQGYSYLKIENFSRNLRVPFGDQTSEGGVILISATIKNESQQPIYIGPGFSLSVTGVNSSIERSNRLLEDDLVSQLVEVKREFKPGDERSGYIALPIKPEVMKKIEEYKKARIEIPGIFDKADSYGKENTIVEKKEVSIALSGEGEGQTASSEAFYPDKVTAEDWGDKKGLVSNTVNKSVEFEGVKVTLDGYQVVDFTPNEDKQARFSNSEAGLVLVTAKITAVNNGKETLKFDNTSGTLTMGKTVKLLNTNMLEEKASSEDLAPGGTGTKYLVFLMDKEEYEKNYKKLSNLLDISIYDQSFGRMTKIGDLSFELTE
ncbi:DUF4352 domain-containing protein [Enterococcus sp. DIV0800]|uniref:DUF4352 domain-containing protein n=1 Tax=unclassified Enterococcus TaxID=2608891 RepID=UPI003D2FA8B9